MITQQTPESFIHGVPLVGIDDRYEDRAAAGRNLADLLGRYRGERAVVLAFPPGGVVVAGELARALRLPLDVMIAREFHTRAFPQVVAGAMSEGGGLCLNAAAIRLPGMSMDDIWNEARHTRLEIISLLDHYRPGHTFPSMNRRSVILVDDGLCSGLHHLAAIQALRRAHIQRCIVATTGGSRDTAAIVKRLADDFVMLSSLESPYPGCDNRWQRSISDDEAAPLLQRYQFRPQPVERAGKGQPAEASNDRPRKLFNFSSKLAAAVRGVPTSVSTTASDDNGGSYATPTPGTSLAQPALADS